MMRSDNRRDGDVREQWLKARGFMRRMLRFWPTALIVLALGGLACAAFLTLRQPDFRSETVILMSDSVPVVEGSSATHTSPQDSAVRLREMVMSRQRLQELIEKYGLYPETRARYGMVDAIDEFRKDIDFRAPGGDTFTLAYEGKSPEHAKQITEDLAASLVKEEGSLRKKKAELNREFLKQEQARAKETLEKAERELATFLADNPSLAADAAMLMPGMPSTGAAIRAAQAQEHAAAASAAAAQRWRTVVTVTGGGGGSAVAAPAEEVMREAAAAKTRAETDLSAAQSELSSLKMRFTPEHPDVRAAQNRVNRLRARASSATATFTSLRTRAQQAQQAAPAERQTVRKRVPVRATSKDKSDKKEAKARADEAGSHVVVELETSWAALTRNASEARAKADQIDTSLFKAKLAASSETGGSKMVVLDPAYLPMRPEPPGKMTIVGIFGLLSLLVGMTFSGARALVDDRIVARRDLEGTIDLLGEVPPLDKSRRTS